MVGRQAYVSGSSLAVWEVAMVGRAFTAENRAAETSWVLGWPVARTQAALRYADDFPDEVETALADNDAYDFDRVTRELPGVRKLAIPADSPAAR